ncbi:unnamed protein product [Ectocarpus sp. 6 AP-2014]
MRNLPFLRSTFGHLLSSRAGGGGVLIVVHAVAVRPLTSHPYKAGTEHAGFSPDQALTSPSAKRREVFGESHEGLAASC